MKQTPEIRFPLHLPNQKKKKIKEITQMRLSNSSSQHGITFWHITSPKVDFVGDNRIALWQLQHPRCPPTSQTCWGQSSSPSGIHSHRQTADLRPAAHCLTALWQPSPLTDHNVWSAVSRLPQQHPQNSLGPQPQERTLTVWPTCPLHPHSVARKLFSPQFTLFYNMNQ